MAAGQQFAESPINALHAALDGRDTRPFRMIEARVENLKFIPDKRIHIANDAQFLGEKAAALFFIAKNNDGCGQSKDQIVGNPQTGMSSQNEVRAVSDNQDQGESQTGEENSVVGRGQGTHMRLQNLP